MEESYRGGNGAQKRWRTLLGSKLAHVLLLLAKQAEALLARPSLPSTDIPKGGRTKLGAYYHHKEAAVRCKKDN